MALDVAEQIKRHWIPAFAGMTSQETAFSTVRLPTEENLVGVVRVESLGGEDEADSAVAAPEEPAPPST